MPAAADACITTPRHAGAFPRPLGIGFNYFASLPESVYDTGLLDFVEVSPEMLCGQRRDAQGTHLALIPARLERARRTCANLPMTVHGVELSIGSAHGWNAAYVPMLDALQTEWPFLWHSEHLSFQTFADASGEEVAIGTPLPLPMTREAADLVATRASELLERYRVPFLLENPAHYLDCLPCDDGIDDEFALMNRITSSSGCGQLLDLHNLYCNALNRRFDAFAAVERFDLSRVVEIHIAGGSWHAGYWMDAHDGVPPEPVWDLLEHTLPRCPNLAGVVFELLEMHALRMDVATIVDTLERLRRAWNRRDVAQLRRDHAAA